MDFNDATALMRLVQAVENDPYVSSGAGEALADKVREFIEDEAELGGWYTELMNAIGEGEPTFRECGTFTDHGFGFHAQDGTRTDYVIGWPFEEGLFTCPPNRAVYATKGMEEAGYLSMMDYSSPVKEGELYSILCGDLVAVGFDFETGENRDLSADEMSRVADYFTEVSKPGSGIEEVIAIRTGQRREEARSEDGRVTLKGEAQASRAASEKLAEGRDTGSPALDDHSIV